MADPVSPIPVYIIILAAAAIGALVRGLKSNTFNLSLASLGIPPIPKRALPFVAGALGILAGVLDAVIRGSTWKGALITAFYGLASGALATWGHEAAVEGANNGIEVGGGGRPRDVVEEPSAAPAQTVTFPPVNNEALDRAMAELRKSKPGDVIVEFDGNGIPPTVMNLGGVTVSGAPKDPAQ